MTASPGRPRRAKSIRSASITRSCFRTLSGQEPCQYSSNHAFICDGKRSVTVTVGLLAIFCASRIRATTHSDLGCLDFGLVLGGSNGSKLVPLSACPLVCFSACLLVCLS